MSNTPRAQHIYSVINDIEDKLNRRSRVIEDQNYNTYQQLKLNNLSSDRYEIINSNNINSQTQFLQIPADRIIDASQIANLKNQNIYLSQTKPYVSTTTSFPQNDIMSPTNEYYIKKLIKDEFSTLIIPYQKEMQNNCTVLENKINSSQYPDYNNIPLDLLKPSPNNIDVNKFTPRTEYEDKIRELNNKINNLISYCDEIKNSYEKLQKNSINNDSGRKYNNYIDKNEFYNTINDLNNKMNNMDSSLNTYKNKVKIQIDDMENFMKNNQNDMKYDNLTSENNRIKNDISNLQNDVLTFKNYQKDLESLSKIDLKQLGKLNLYDINRFDLNTLNELKDKTGEIDDLKNNYNDIYKKQNENDLRILTIENKISSDNNNKYDDLKNEIDQLKNQINGLNESGGFNNNNNLIDNQKLNNLENNLKSHIQNDYNPLNNNFENLQNENQELKRKIENLSQLNIDKINNLPYQEINNMNFKEIKEIPKLKLDIDNLKNTINNLTTKQESDNLKNLIDSLEKKNEELNNKQNQIELRIDNINNTSFNSSIKQPDDFNLSSNQLNNIKKNVEDLKGKIKEIENNNNNNNLISTQKLSSLENTLKAHINNDYYKLNNDLKNLQNEFLKYQRLDIDELSKLNFDNLKNLNYYELNNLNFQELKETPKLKSEIDNLKKSNEIINNQLTSIQNQLALLGNQRNDNLDLNNLISSKINVQPQLDERTIENLKKIDLEKLSKLNLDALLSLNIENLSNIDLTKLEELIRKAERTQDENQKLFSMFGKYNKKISSLEKDFEDRESNIMESLGDNGVGALRSEVEKLKNQFEERKNNKLSNEDINQLNNMYPTINDFNNLKKDVEELKEKTDELNNNVRISQPQNNELNNNKRKSQAQNDLINNNNNIKENNLEDLLSDERPQDLKKSMKSEKSKNIGGDLFEEGFEREKVKSNRKENFEIGNNQNNKKDDDDFDDFDIEEIEQT